MINVSLPKSDDWARRGLSPRVASALLGALALLVLILLFLARGRVVAGLAYWASWASFDVPLVVKWCGVFIVLELVVSPWTWAFTQHLPDRGVALNKGVGLLAVTYVAWIVGSLHLLPYDRTPPFVWLVVLAALVLASVRWLRVPLSRPSSESVTRWLLAEAVFLALFVVYLEVEMHNTRTPMHFGDQPLDSALVNSIGRSSYFPPLDPWFAGARLNYYYLGHLSQSFLWRITGTTESVAYSLSMTSVMTLTTTIAFAAGWALTRSRWGGALVGLTVGLADNFELLAQVISRHTIDGLEPGLATGLVHGTFADPPYVTFALGELHAQFLALPTLALLCAVTSALLTAPREALSGPPRWSSLFIAGLVVGLPGLTNLYSLPPALAIWALAYAALWLRSRDWRLVRDCLMGLGISILGYLPFYLTYHGTAHASLVPNGTPTPVYAIAMLFGVFIVPLAAWGLLSSRRGISLSRQGTATLTLVGLAALELVLGLEVARRVLVEGGLPNPALLVYGAMFIICVERGLAAVRSDASIEHVFAWVLAIASFGALLGIEVITLDVPTPFTPMRFNVAWKTYLSVWIPLALASGVAISALARWPGTGSWRLAARGAAGVAAALVVFGAISGMLSSYTTMDHLREKPGLDGLAFLKTAPDVEKQAQGAIDWLNTHAADGDVELEAGGGRAYPFTRISAHTGLPTVLGWEHAVAAWQGFPASIKDRLTDIAMIYTNVNPPRTRDLLAQYHVRYIVIGDLETAVYGSVDREGLAQIAPVVYEDGTMQILEVPDDVLGARAIGGR